MSYLSKRGYVLKKETLTQEQLFEIKKELRAKPLVDEKYNKNILDESYPVYIDTKTKLYIPKMYGIKKFGYPEIELENYIGKDWDHKIDFSGKLYERQEEPCKALYEACLNDNGGILEAKTGTGKTLMSLYVLSKLKCKTIIVVNKITLLNQWKEEINKFLPNASVGILQGQKNVDIIDKDITVAMLKSLSVIDYPDELFKDFKCVIFDEIHNTSTKSSSKVLSKLCCKYTIGLSATPIRADGCEYVFKWHIGEIIYKSTVERNGKPPIIRCLKITSTDYKEVYSTNKYTGLKTIQFTTMLTELTEMEKRNKLIIEIVKDCIKNKRKILVLSDRRNHLNILFDILNNDPNVSFTYGLFLGKMKIEELKKSKACDVILATVAAFGEGISEKDLDTLILCTPKKFIGHLKNKPKNENNKIEQIVGRIFRKDHITLSPLIIDLQDHFSVYKNQTSGRNAFYKLHFKNGIFENQSINLDECALKDISMKCITTKKQKKIDEPEPSNLITQFCMLDEDE
jgi:superfamily II DNA or RNA helicase